MDGTRTVKEILLEGLQTPTSWSFPAWRTWSNSSHVGNFLDRRYVDGSEALDRALKPRTFVGDKLAGSSRPSPSSGPVPTA